jgi:hypothetical protein
MSRKLCEAIYFPEARFGAYELIPGGKGNSQRWNKLDGSVGPDIITHGYRTSQRIPVADISPASCFAESVEVRPVAIVRVAPNGFVVIV